MPPVPFLDPMNYYFTRQLTKAIEKLRDDLQGTVRRYAEITDEILRAAREHADRSKDIQPLWVEDLISKFQKTVRQSSADSQRQERIQNSIRWATWSAFMAACIYATISAFQWNTMNQTYREIQAQTKAAQWSAYMACLNVQATQSMFIQAQNSAGDSHAMAASSVRESAAELESQRAFVVFTPRMPEPQELVVKQLAIPYTIKNSGRSTAINMVLQQKAVLLRSADVFHIEHSGFGRSSGNLGPGEEYPAEPEGNLVRGTAALKVRDLRGKDVSASSAAARDFMNGNAVVMVYGEIKYSDFAGVHTQRACQTIGIMRAGTARVEGASANEITCLRYNHNEDKYFGEPKMEAPMKVTLPVPVSCLAPK